jgi:biotin carboxyl carrier protein
MTFEVEVCGRLRTVSIERADGGRRFRVTLDGQPFLVDAVRTGDYGLSLLAAVPFSGRGGPQPATAAPTISTDVQLAPGPAAGELLASLAGRTAAVVVNGRRRGRAAEAGALGHGEVTITAPMPGRVVRVLVEPGQEVAARQGIVVVEAMKMENELRTPRPGRVRDIAVAPGTSVEAGRILAIIE